MLPPPDPASGNLPPGIHEASWDESVERFGRTVHRRELLRGLYEAMLALRAAGCQRLYLNGSFVTEKAVPGDFDGCWEMAGVDFEWLSELEPALLDWSDRRAAQKARFGGELFIAEAIADTLGTEYLEFFSGHLSANPRELSRLIWENCHDCE